MPSDTPPTRIEQLAWSAIRDNAKLAQAFAEGMSEGEFAADRRTFYAVTRCLEIISEAARRLRGPQQSGNPQLEWRQIEDSGNVFRHIYQHVAENLVLMTVRERLPALVDAAEAALSQTSDDVQRPE